MSVIYEDIPNTEQVIKALYANVSSLVRIRYVGESKIPGIDATKLAPCVLPAFYKNIADEVEKFKVFKDDIWVTSYPKCGTTWTQEMVWLITNDLDFEGARKTPLMERYGFLEFSSIFGASILSEKSSVQYTKELRSPRFIKSHLPIALLPTEFWTIKPKLVYVARNPKDAAISFYHHYVNLHLYKGTLEDFLEIYLNGLACWSPFTDHILDYWKLRDESNILFITYEEMSINLKNILQKVAKFFDKTYTDDQLNQLVKHLSFDEMKKNDAVNYEQAVKGIQKLFNEKQTNSEFRFMRRGHVNSAIDEMPVEYQKKFDVRLAESFKGSDFKF